MAGSLVPCTICGAGIRVTEDKPAPVPQVCGRRSCIVRLEEIQRANRPNDYDADGNLKPEPDPEEGPMLLIEEETAQETVTMTAADVGEMPAAIMEDEGIARTERRGAR